MLLKFLCEKLTRDNTPKRYQAEGGNLETRTLNDAEFSRELHKKLLEEVYEVIEAKSQDDLVAELADVQEVIHAIAKINSIKLSDIESSRLQKVAERGSFSQRLYSTIGTIPENTHLGLYIQADPHHYPLIHDAPLNHTLETNTGAWKRFFGELRNDILNTLPEYVVSVMHIGTTTLQKAPAQPIVDMVAAVTSLLDFDLHSKALMKHGWLARGENKIANRRFFVKLDTHNGKEVAHLHCFEHTDAHIKKFVQFTHMLKENSELREEYTHLRESTLKEASATPTSYQATKTAFIEKTLS